MEVLTDTKNELFKRQELVFELDSEKNPGFDEIRKKVSEKVGKPEDQIDVYNIKGGFGKSSFRVGADVYDSKEDLDSVKKLQMTSKQRKEGAKASEEAKESEAAPAEEKATEESKEEASEEKAEAETKEEPAEEVKEESK